VAPLGLIGVVAALLLSGRPLGFVAILGILALFGMITKNAVILIGQIEAEREHGKTVRQAAIDASSSRFRPIMLTAVSTVLGMIPIAPTVFWGPMAFAIMGGLLVGTVLTLVSASAVSAIGGISVGMFPANHAMICAGLSVAGAGAMGALALQPFEARPSAVERSPARLVLAVAACHQPIPDTLVPIHGPQMGWERAFGDEVQHDRLYLVEVTPLGALSEDALGLGYDVAYS
jgi:hypothetical protein